MLLILLMSKGSKEALTILLLMLLMSKGSKMVFVAYVHNIDTYIHSIGWYGWKGLSLSFPKLFEDQKSVKY